MKKNYWKEKDGKYLLEKEALNLAFNYFNIVKQKTNRHINKGKVKQSKYWKYFLNVIEKYGTREEWDSFRYVESVFDSYGLVYPQQLAREDYWENYIGIYKRGYINQEKAIAYELLSAYKTIETWSEKKGYDTVNIRAYFKNPLNIYLLDRGKISLYFLSICKTFKDYYFSLDIIERRNIASINTLESKRRAIFINEKILKKMKDIMKEEFDGRKFI